MSAVLSAPFSVCAQILPPPPPRPSLDANGVDAQSAEFQYSQKLMSIGPEGQGGLSYAITYSGGTWRHTYSNLLVHVSGDFIPTTQNVTIANSNESFTWGVPESGNGSSIPGGGGTDYLQRDGTFAPFGHYVAGGYDPITSVTTGFFFADYIEFPNGVRWTFHYRDDMGGGISNTRLQSVTSNTGFQMKFNYQSNSMTSDPASRIPWVTVTSVVAINNAVDYCDPDADTCSVTGWSTVQHSGVSSVTDPLGNTTYFDRDPASYFKVRTPDSGSYNIIYNTGFAVDPCINGLGSKVTSATINGQTTNYTYSQSPGAGTETVVSSAPLSQTYTYVSDVNLSTPALCRFGVRTVTDPLSRVTGFTYDAYGRLLRTTSPEGNYTQNTIDNSTAVPPASRRGNITQISANPKPGSGAPTLSESWAFPVCAVGDEKICNQPGTYTDPRSNVTTYTYSTSHGGVLTETGPANPAGIQPVKRYAYAQRYAWIKNSGGSFVQAPTPVWVRTEEKTCANTATVGNACAGGSSDEIVTSYDYGPNSGPNNLLVRGKVVTASGASLRTCFGYDKFGNKISETLPRAGLTSCP